VPEKYFRIFDVAQTSILLILFRRLQYYIAYVSSNFLQKGSDTGRNYNILPGLHYAVTTKILAGIDVQIERQESKV